MLYLAAVIGECCVHPHIRLVETDDANPKQDATAVRYALEQHGYAVGDVKALDEIATSIRVDWTLDELNDENEEE